MKLSERAEALARKAHAGQVDKAGRPYIEHVERVVAGVAGDDEAEAVAWLHDVKEDCPGFVAEVNSFPMSVLWSVDLLTRDCPEYFYYARIRSNPLALRVKLSDIADNVSEDRLQLLDEKTAARLRRKYKKAMRELGL